MRDNEHRRGDACKLFVSDVASAKRTNPAHRALDNEREETVAGNSRRHHTLDLVEAVRDEGGRQSSHEPVVRIEFAVPAFEHDAQELHAAVERTPIGNVAERSEQRA